MLLHPLHAASIDRPSATTGNDTHREEAQSSAFVLFELSQLAPTRTRESAMGPAICSGSTLLPRSLRASLPLAPAVRTLRPNDPARSLRLSPPCVLVLS